MTDKDNITLPRKHIDYAAHALEHFNKDAPDQLVSEIIHHLRTALAAEQPKPEPVAWQCREHGDDEWFGCSKEAYGINPSRYVYRPLYAAPPDAEAMRRDAERLREELEEDAGVIAVWRGRTERAEAENERLREALKLASNSRGMMLLSDPPQDAWKFNRVDEVIVAALRREET